MFGRFVKECRLKADLSLREFCRMTGEDASNWSKVERELLAPPTNVKKLRTIAQALNIKQDSEEWNNFIDYSALDNGRIPPYVKSDKEIMNALPVFFRTVGSVKPTTNELHEFIHYLREKK
ncbi:helix-turn-helix domain-containing protein [Candidatus Latescibacterota bacterium]